MLTCVSACMQVRMSEKQQGLVGKNMDYGARLPQFKSWPLLLVTVRFQRSHLTPLCFSFFAFKMGTTILLLMLLLWEFKWINTDWSLFIQILNYDEAVNSFSLSPLVFLQGYWCVWSQYVAIDPAGELLCIHVWAMALDLVHSL